MALRKGDVCFSVLLLTLVFLSIALIIWSDPDNYFNLSGDIEIPNKGIFISTIICFHTPLALESFDESILNHLLDSIF